MNRKPWRKLWHEKLLSSTRFRRLRPYDKGVYFQLILLADDAGRVVSGKLPISPKDLAFEMGCERSLRSVQGALDRLSAPECGLISKAPDGPYVVENFEDLAR